MFQQSTDVGIRGLAVLVGQPQGEIVQSSDIGTHLGISGAYITKAFQPLARAGWLRSVRGRAGGWTLAVDPKSVTLRQVVDTLEPAGEWRGCVMGHYVCSDETACPFHATWKKTREEFEAVLERTTLEDLARFAPPVVPSRIR